MPESIKSNTPAARDDSAANPAASSDACKDDDLRPRHAKSESDLNSKTSKKGLRRALTVLLMVLILIAVAAGAFYIWQEIESQRLADEIENTEIPITPEEISEEDELVDNPIDFETLQAEYPDLYSWIYIPDTNINLGVYQHESDDTFYLDHDGHGDYFFDGVIFSQRVNSLDYSDPVTLLYGHNLKNDTMFTQLHYFEDAEFFDSHENFYIYTPGHILTYEIVAAYQYDNRHIMNSFDFTDEATRRSYFDYVVDPDSLVCNVREGVTLADDDTIVQLSTCTGDGDHNKRYIVTGVLVDDQLTR